MPSWMVASLLDLSAEWSPDGRLPLGQPIVDVRARPRQRTIYNTVVSDWVAGPTWTPELHGAWSEHTARLPR
ncbi:MAG TPA: hypothetical protein VHN14_31255 [Kofleriaceae bacterium]|nr:hypothetical protein [Kofleriaceae bacterium]